MSSQNVKDVGRDLAPLPAQDVREVGLVVVAPIAGRSVKIASEPTTVHR